MKERLNLILWEKANGYKAKDIAKKLRITESAYCNIKKGKSTPSIDFAYRFSDCFPNENVLDLFKTIETNKKEGI